MKLSLSVVITSNFSFSKTGNTYFWCKYCCVDLQGGISAVKKHNVRKKHEENVKNSSLKVKQNIFELAKRADDRSTQIKSGEIKIAMFLAEHNLALSLSDHLIPLIKSLDPESKILQGLQTSRTKATQLVKNVIGCYSSEETIMIISRQKFSLIIDSSTDRTKLKHLVLVVRYEEDFVTKDSLLALLELKEGTAEHMYQAIVDFFNSKSIPYHENMIGLAFDGENTNTGNKNSLKTRFVKDIPQLFVLTCTCHSLALCSSHASEKLPNDMEHFIQSVYGYFKNSSKRQILFENVQKLLEIKPHKMLKYCPLRWLSMNSCITRILEQYDALFEFFRNEKTANEAAKVLFEKMSNPYTIMYLEFLEYVLPFVNKVNVEFQSEKPKIFTLYRKMESMYLTIVEWFIKDECMKNDAKSLNHREVTNMRKLEDVYLGPKVMARMETMNRKYSNSLFIFKNLF